MKNRQSFNQIFVLMALAIGLWASQPATHAASYTWTNTANNTSGFWTNGILWGQLTNTTFPGSAAAGSAYLTNASSSVYTNILNATLTNRLNILTISNKLGESWLVVTNAQLMNTNALTLGTGGRLRIDNGGVISNTISLTLTGVNAAVLVNNGAKLIATNSVTIGNGAGSTGNSLVITNGGWMAGKTIAIGNNATASNNVVLVTGSSTIWSNTGVLTIGNGNSNTLTIAQGAQVYLDNVQFGTGTGNQVVLTDTGTVVIASSASFMNLAGNYSTFIVSNGARFYETGATGYVQGSGSNNTFIVTGPGSVFTNSNASGIVLNNGATGMTNKLVISNYGLVVTPQTTLKSAPGMQLLVTGGGVLTNKSGLQVGSSGTGYVSAVISNGGAIINKTGATYVGLGGSGSFASNSTMLVTGVGSVLSNAAGGLSLGQYGSANLLTIANGGNVYSTSGYIGQTSTSHYNVAILTDTGSVWTINGALGVGYESSGLGFGVGNQLVVSNGALLTSTFGNIGYGLSAISNAVTVTGPGSQWNDTGTLVIGSSASGNYNSLSINNGGRVFATAVTIGASGNNNTITVSDPGTILRGIGTLSLGTNGFGNQLIVSNGAVVVNGASTLGNAVGSNSNAVTVTGTGSVWSNSDVVAIGPVGIGNRVTVQSGGALQMGMMIVYPTSTLTVNGGLIEEGPFINFGTLLVGNSQTFTFTGSSFSNDSGGVLINPSGWMVLSGTSPKFNLVAGSSSNTFNFSGGTLQFSAAQTYTFGLAGQDFGGRLGATNNNYFIGNLVVSASGGTLTLAGGPALYVGNLTVASGATLNLQGRNIYYSGSLTTNGATINWAGGHILSLSAQILTQVSITPVASQALATKTRQFTATAMDQFGYVMPTTFSWSVSGGGSIDATGLFTAGGTAGGPYTVTASSSGVSGSATVTVVIDTLAPSIGLKGSNPQYMEVKGSYMEAGATAVDNWDGDLTSSIQINASAVHTNQLGTYLVHYSVSDTSSNPATVDRTVIVRDTTPPVPNCQDQTFAANTNCVATNVYYTASFTDNYDTTVTVKTDLPQGLDLTAGTYPVHATGADSSGNRTNCTFNVIITGSGCGPTVAIPVFSPVPTNGAHYVKAAGVSIYCPTPGAMIHYTTDGTEPTQSSPVVPAGNLVVLGMDTILKAKAWATGLLPSATQTAEYPIDPGQIVAGSDTILALRSDEVVWGYRTSAVMQAGLTNIVKIAANADGHYLALTDLGTLWTWGTNITGQLGDGTTIDRISPVLITSLTNLAAIAGGESHSLAADKNGQVWAWGSDAFGQLGDGLTNVFAAVPHSVLALSNVNAVVVAAGGAHSLALDISGIVWAWGLNSSGQAGNSALTNNALPGTVAGLTNTVVAVAAGYQHSLALGSNGTLWAWGANDHGQLGDGDTNNTATPVTVTELPTNIVAVASGDAHSLALDGTGNVWAWGDNTYGQLGNGTNGDQWVPQLVSGFSNDVVAISASGNLSAALRLNGAVWAWGQCVGSVPGDLTNSDTNVPVQLSGFSMGTWIDSDGDGMPDGWELAHGLNPYDPTDATGDDDGDGLTNLQEYQGGTDPHDYYNGTLPALTVTNGNYQSGGTNQFLSQPLVVLVASSNGVALVNAPVTFTVTQGAGLVATTTNGTLGSSVSLTTDANGRAQVWFRLPSTTATTNQITLTAVSDTNTTQATFTVSTQSTGSGSLLPNWWQIQYFGHTGIDPYADPDSDGIYNLQEYLLGTDPTIAEAGPSTNATTVATVSGSQTNTSVGRWLVKGTTINAADRRGYIEYTINAPAADIYRLELIGFASQHVRPTNNFALSIISMDGVCFTQAWLQTFGASNGVVDAFTPWLTNGPHTVGVLWDNAASYRLLGIRELRLQTVTGTDANGNGVKDWLEYQLAQRNAIFSNQLTVVSCVSPYCLEGKGSYLNMLSLIASTLNASNMPTVLKPRVTPNDCWYADVPLSGTNITTVVAAFENGGTISTQQVQWVARNVLDGGIITIRKGDSLLMNATPTGSTNGSVTMAIGSTTFSTTPLTPITYQFNTVGTYTVSGVYTPIQGSPQGGSLTVQVVGYAFSDSPDCMVLTPRNWTVTGLPAGVMLQTDTRLQAIDTVSNGTHTLGLTIDTAPQRAIAARVSTNGPILDVTMATAFWLYDEVQTYIQVIEAYPDGSELVESMLILSPVLKDLTLQVNLIVGGTIFDDGTTIKFLTAKDFDALGQVKLRFIAAPGTHTANCNTIQIFQGATLIKVL